MDELAMIHGTSGTAAQPIGGCPDCGQMRYAGLTHHCGTQLSPGQVAAAKQPIMLPQPSVTGWSLDLNGAAAA